MLGFHSLEHPLTLSALADDIYILVSDQEDFQCLQDTLLVYEKATSPRVNWGKSEELLLGIWRDGTIPNLPGGLQWGRERLKVSGVFLSTEGYTLKMREGIKKKVCTWLSKWKWLLPQLSYANNLVASTLWHRLMPFDTPKGLIEDINHGLFLVWWTGSGQQASTNL